MAKDTLKVQRFSTKTRILIEELRRFVGSMKFPEPTPRSRLAVSLLMASMEHGEGMAFLMEYGPRYYGTPGVGAGRRWHAFCAALRLTLKVDGVTLSDAAVLDLDARVERFTDWYGKNDPTLLTWMSIASADHSLWNPFPRMWVQRAGDWRWFAERFHVAPERLLVVSRGGTAAWYRPFAANYREIFDYLSPEEFRRRHDERLTANGEQKQTQVLAFERQLLRELTGDVEHRSMLHPSTMYGLFNPFWWRHLDETWVHAHAVYARLAAAPPAGLTLPDRPYTAVKFYFNDCFPATDDTRAFVRRTLQELASRGPVVSLAFRVINARTLRSLAFCRIRRVLPSPNVIFVASASLIPC